VVWSRREFDVLEELATTDPGSPDAADDTSAPPPPA
jgi:hypothetical protein